MKSELLKRDFFAAQVDTDGDTQIYGKVGVSDDYWIGLQSFCIDPLVGIDAIVQDLQDLRADVADRLAEMAEESPSMEGAAEEVRRGYQRAAAPERVRA